MKYILQNVPPTETVTDKQSSSIIVQITFESFSDSVINERLVTEITAWLRQQKILRKAVNKELYSQLSFSDPGQEIITKATVVDKSTIKLKQ